MIIIGDGLLGSNIKKITNWDLISRKKDNIDFTDLNTYIHLIESHNQIFNCVGFTDTYSEDKETHWKVNYESVANLVDYCNSTNKKIIHISTDYIYSNSKLNASENDVPVHCANWYGYTKLLSDGYIQLKSKNYLLIRCSFKPNPFPYENVVIQQGNFDYVDVISKLIIELINKNANGIYNVGTEVKTMYDLANRTKKVKILDKKIHETMPTDISMDCLKLNKFLNE